MPSDYSNPVHEYSIWMENLNENLSARNNRALNINAHYVTKEMIGFLSKDSMEKHKDEYSVTYQSMNIVDSTRYVIN